MQLIEIWETFLMQLDAEDGEKFVPPAGVVASPTAEGRPSSSDSTEADRADKEAAQSRLADALHEE